MSDSRVLPAIQAEVLPLPGRWSGLRSGNLPVLPIAILGILILTAIFADVLAPSDPEVGTLTDRFKPPTWIEGGSRAHLLGADHDRHARAIDALPISMARACRSWSASLPSSSRAPS